MDCWRGKMSNPIASVPLQTTPMRKATRMLATRTVVDCEKKSVSRSVELELAGEVKDIKLPEFFGLIKRLVLMTGQVEHRTTDNQEHGDMPAREDTDKEEERAGRYRLPRKRTVKRQTRTRYARDAGN